MKRLSIILLIIFLVPSCIFASTSNQIIDITKKGSITIYVLQDRTGNVITSKGTGEIQEVPLGAQPLKDVFFDLYLVDSDYLETEIPKENIEYIGNLGTDKDGMLKFSELELGRYLVVPTKFPSNVDVTIANFLVDVPMTNEAMDAWNYDVIVYPKVLTVYGSVVLNVRGENGLALQNVKFELFKKNENGVFEKYNNTEYILADHYTTNVNGQICIENLPKGEYQFIGIDVPEGYGLNNTPINFIIENTNVVEGNEEAGWEVENEDLSLGFDNYLTPISTDFKFDITLRDSKTGSAKFDETHLWKIHSKIPKDIENYTRFLVELEINEKLLLTQNSIKVMVGENELILDKDYKVEYNNNLLKISFVSPDMKPDSLKDNEDMEISFITNFDREKVVMGEDIEVFPRIYWDTIYDEDGLDTGEDVFNPVGDDLDKKEDALAPASIHTGGLKVKKVSEEGKLLADAVFKIADSKENARKGIYIKIDGEDIVETSDENGLLYFEGLPYGNDGDINDEASRTYWLVEIKAPLGYNLLSSPIEVVIDSDSYHTDKPITIENRAGLIVPETGGIGTIIFFTIGGLFVIISLKLLKGNKKENKK